MRKYAELLRGVKLFRGFAAEEIVSLVSACGGSVSRLQKGACAIRKGQRVSSIGILLAGEMVGQTVTAQGAATTVHHMLPGAVFGDLLSGSSGTSPVTVTALADSEVLWLPLLRLLEAPGGPGVQGALFLRNLVETISDKYFAQSARLELLCERRLRSRIAHYLLSLWESGGSSRILLPQQSRAQLADYLACERSALSRELSRMQKDGLIACRRREVQLLDIPALEQL